MFSADHCGQDGAAAAHDAGDALARHGNVLAQHSGVDGHVIDALLGLLLDHFQHHGRRQVTDPRDAREGLVDGHGADGNRAVAQVRLADRVDVAARREVHDRIGAKVHGGVQLLKFGFKIRGRSRNSRCWR